jgi:hypothetical protein
MKITPLIKNHFKGRVEAIENNISPLIKGIQANQAMKVIVSNLLK